MAAFPGRRYNPSARRGRSGRRRVAGARALSKKLRRLDDEIVGDIKITVESGADELVAAMKRYAPDYPGPPRPLGLYDRRGARRFTGPRRELKDDIRKARRKKGLAYVVGIFGKRESSRQNAILAIWSNFGTRHFPKTRFMDRAVNERRDRILFKMRRATDEALRRAMAKPVSDS